MIADAHRTVNERSPRERDTTTMLRNDFFHPELDEGRDVADEQVDALLVGAVDLHIHASPSPFPRRLSILEAAEDAANAGFRAIGCKSHHDSTQPMIDVLRPSLADLDITVIGGIALNWTVGGLSPYATEHTLKSGGRIVWMPTLSAVPHCNRKHDPTSTFAIPARREGTPITVLDADGSILADVHEVLALIAEYDAILNFGHLAAAEVEQLLPAAKAAGVQRMMLSHPTLFIEATLEQTAAWAREGVVIEQCIATCRKLDPEVNAAYIDAAGVDRTMFSSDYGQRKNPLPVTGYRRLVRSLLDEGRSEDDVVRMVSGTGGELIDGLVLEPA